VAREFYDKTEAILSAAEEKIKKSTKPHDESIISSVPERPKRAKTSNKVGDSDANKVGDSDDDHPIRGLSHFILS
jgi:hypothetical protein